MSQNPGDIFVDVLTINSQRTSGINMARNFLSGEVTETIFTPGVTASIKVLDQEDYLGQLKLAGDEGVTFQFRKPQGGTAKYEFHLNSCKDVSDNSNKKYKIYELDCISRETLKGQTNHIQKGYNTTIEDIVKDLHGKLESNLPIRTEGTKGKRSIKLTNQPVLHAMDKMRKQAVSEQYKGSNYMFWLTHSGFWFKTLEGMMEEGPVKTFKQDNAVGRSQFSDIDNQVLGWQVHQSMDAVNRIHSGAMKQRVATFDVHSNRFVYKDFKPGKDDVKSLGKGDFLTDAFKSMFGQGFRTVVRMVDHNPDLKQDPSHIPDALPYRMKNLAQMQEQRMSMTVIGDPVLEAGKIIMNNIPVSTSHSGFRQNDPQVSGKWLISKVRHEIKSSEARPRWVTHLECLKGSSEESL